MSMLKRIDNVFERRKKSLIKSQGITKQIKDNLQTFLKEKFSSDLKGLSIKIAYQSNENSLTIQTSSKVIANELTINLQGIEESLQKSNLKLSRILIR